MSFTPGAEVLIIQDISSVHRINRGSSQVRETDKSAERQTNHATEADVNQKTGLESAYQMQLEGNWKQFTGRVKEAWGVLTDDDVDRAEGKVDQLAGTIEEKTGEARAAISRKLNELASSIQG